MELISRVMEVFSRIDQQVVEFQLKTGLRCPAGCGECCRSGNIQTTVIEMLPAARAVLGRGEAEQTLEHLRRASLDGRCIFFHEKSAALADGCCELYALRPAVCRLFGFASIRDRSGQLKLAFCRRLLQSDPLAIANATAHSVEAPWFSKFGTLMLSLEIGHRLVPINTALYQAIMRLGLHLQLLGNEGIGQAAA